MISDRYMKRNLCWCHKYPGHASEALSNTQGDGIYGVYCTGEPGLWGSWLDQLWYRIRLQMKYCWRIIIGLMFFCLFHSLNHAVYLRMCVAARRTTIYSWNAWVTVRCQQGHELAPSRPHSWKKQDKNDPRNILLSCLSLFPSWFYSHYYLQE